MKMSQLHDCYRIQTAALLLGVSNYRPHFEWGEFEFRFLGEEIGKGGKQHFEGGVQTREETMQFICLTNAWTY